jgi:hypothetical protein
MARPSLGRPSLKTTNKVQPRPAAPKEKPEVQAARQAVVAFERQYSLLQQMRADWEQKFQKAKQALDVIKQQEDIVRDAINKAKPLVSEAGMTIGDFIAQKKWSTDHYDDDEVTRLLTTMDNGPEVLHFLLQEGVLKSVVLDKKAAVAWFAQHPDYADSFNPAFRKKQEMTTAVTVPSI